MSQILEMILINYEIHLRITCLANYVITDSMGAQTFAITDTKLDVPEVTLSIQVNTNVQQQLKSGFKRTINLNKYQSKLLTQALNQYLLNLLHSNIQGPDRRFASSFDDNKVSIGHT